MSIPYVLFSARGAALTFVLSAAVLQLNCGDYVNQPSPNSYTRGSASGRVIDEAGQPVVHARLRFSSSSDTVDTFTGLDGEFDFVILDAGTWILRVADPGYQAEPVTLRIEGGVDHSLPVVVARLVSGDIRGFLRLGDTGGTVVGVPLKLLRSGSEFGSTTSGAGGAFIFANVPLGVFQIVVAPLDYYDGGTVSVEVRSRVNNLPPISLLRVRGSVVGRLRYAHTAAPVPGATVKLSNASTTLLATSTNDGTYTFPTVPFGSWALVVDSASWHGGKTVSVLLDQALLTVPDVLLDSYTDPAVRQIIYSSCAEGDFWYGCWRDAGIRIVDENGGRDRVLAFTQFDAIDPAWAPGPKIVFVLNGALHVMNPDGSSVTQVFGAVFPSMVRFPTWSPDGTRIAFVLQNPLPPYGGLYTIRPDGTGRTLVASGGSITVPTWSPDGSRIAYSDCAIDFCDIVVANADGSTVTLTGSANDVLFFSPNWSPNGSELVVLHCRRNAGCQLALLDEGTRALTPLNAAGECPVWSPDGSKIALVAGASIEIVTRTGQRVTTIPTPTLFSCGIGWSP